MAIRLSSFRLASIIAAALPFVAFAVFVPMDDPGRWRWVGLLGVIGGPLISYATGLYHDVRINQRRNKAALVTHTLGAVTLVLGLGWTAMFSDDTRDVAAIFEPDVVFLLVSYLCLCVGAFILMFESPPATRRHERGEAG